MVVALQLMVSVRGTEEIFEGKFLCGGGGGILVLISEVSEEVVGERLV